MESNHCFHCGDKFPEKDRIVFDDKSFCCTGCKTVYEIFSENDLISYYDLEKTPGATPQETHGKYNFLDNEKIVDKLLEFKESDLQITSLYIPHIHCSSCIWILENLSKLQSGIITSQVNFPQKKVRITFNPNQTDLKAIVLLLSKIGYEPYISLENYQSKKPKIDRSLIYKAGVAFFCYGNIMLLSFPEYFGNFGQDDLWLEHYTPFFRWLIFALAIPSFFYSGSVYHKAAYQSIKMKTFDINVPMSLGLVVMFVRSTIDIVFDLGPGFFDSLSSLIFLMLVGKLFQQKTYDFLSFERDFKSYFPIAVTRINSDKTESSVSVYDVEKGDKLLIRNQELIPVDGILLSDSARIDYSFVTGEAAPIRKSSGDKLFAGGKQLGNMVEMQVLNSVSQSYLTQLWDNEVFRKKSGQNYKTLITKVSQYFTPILLLIAFAGLSYWLFIDANIAFNVFTAVLIIACPCALALTTPFTLGNVIRIFGNKKFYLKNTTVIEQLSKIDTIVFDKTGTITSGNKAENIVFEGKPISLGEQSLIKNLVHISNHPLSRKLYDFLPESEKAEVTAFEEIPGKGIQGIIHGKTVRVGSAAFVGAVSEKSLQTSTHISIDNHYIGKFVFVTVYRKGLKELFAKLSKTYQLKILSGDNEGEREALQALLPETTELVFNQKPDQKLRFIEALQQQGHNVMMIGDGLNDAGALAQSNVGISLSEDVNIFSPACDGILDASKFDSIEPFMQMSKKSIVIIKTSFTLSLIYNVIGISVALMGLLSPLVAAILMPISTVTIVGFVTVASNLWARRIL
ncbi:MAG: heavy metal translocating P-type ATPase metal-binding domain-containing protein [Flavobacteriaceae bacterium]